MPEYNKERKIAVKELRLLNFDFNRNHLELLIGFTHIGTLSIYYIDLPKNLKDLEHFNKTKIDLLKLNLEFLSTLYFQIDKLKKVLERITGPKKV